MLREELLDGILSGGEFSQLLALCALLVAAQPIGSRQRVAGQTAATGGPSPPAVGCTSLTDSALQ